MGSQAGSRANRSIPFDVNNSGGSVANRGVEDASETVESAVEARAATARIGNVLAGPAVRAAEPPQSYMVGVRAGEGVSTCRPPLRLFT